VRARRGLIIGSLLSSAALAALIAGPALAASPPEVSIPVPPVIPAPPVAPLTATPPAQIGTVSPGHPILNFTGAVDNPTPLPAVSDPTPPACAIECQEYQFRNVGPGTPILVSIKSTSGGATFDPNDGYNLYVYGPSGHLAGSSNGVGANGQSVLLDPSTPGTYTVVVTVTYAYDTGAGWVGEIRLIDSKTWNPAPATCGITVGGVTGCFDLPTLRVLPPYDFTASGVPPVVSTPLGFPLPLSLPTPTSCYADETIGLDNPSPTAVTNPVTRCLRFTSDVQNTGAGPVRVGIPLLTADASGQPQSGYVPGDCHAVQYVTSAAGSAVTRPAGDCEFHPEHGHFHYDALVGYSLHALDATGGIGPAVSVSHKESFCLTDDDYFGYGTAGPNGPRQNVGQPDCNLPRSITTPTGGPGSGTYVTEGISPGWGDVYTWDTPDQYIDVTNVPSGTYWVVEETNPSGSLLVAGPEQTCSATEIQLTSGSSSDTVQALQSVAGITCPA
jgi:hypothetical protein